MGSDGPIRRKTVVAFCVAGAIVLSATVVWLAVRLPWRHDPLQLGVYERLIEAEGYVCDDTGPGDGVDGYVLRTHGRGRWAERTYVHPETGGRLELTRNLLGNEPGVCCTGRSHNEEGRLALRRIAGEFSPWLAGRIVEAEAQSARTGRWVRVTAPDFDLSVTAHSLTVDSRPGEYTGMGLGRVFTRAFWKVSRLLGRA